MTPEQFKDSMAYLGIAYGKEFTQQELTIYYDFLKEFTDETLVKAIKNIIKKSKFLPKITEILEECENCKEHIKHEVIEFMLNMGYFKKGINGELDSTQALRNYEKTCSFIERGIVPEWLQDDMNYYYKLMKQERLDHQERLMIGG